MSVRQEKVASRMRQVVAAGFLALRDPRLNLLTVTEVKVSPDLSHARVFYTMIEAEGIDRKAVETALAGARGHFRSLVGRELQLRQTPEIHFIFDETEVKAFRLEAILDGLKKHEASPDPVPEASSEPVPESMPATEPTSGPEK